MYVQTEVDGRRVERAVQTNLHPEHSQKTGLAMKAERVVNRITFDRSEANPGETLYVYVPKLDQNEVLVPGTLALVFKIDLAGGDADNFLVQNVTRALVDKLHVKFGAETLQDTDGYDIYKIWEDLFLSQEERDDMLLEGIQSEDLCKIRSDSGDKKTSGVDKENALEKVYGKKYRIRLDHSILTDHGVFYPQALLHDLLFQLKLAPASQVVKGSDPDKLKYKLTNIQLEFETIRSKTLADEARSVYTAGKGFKYDHVVRPEVVSFKKEVASSVTIKFNAQKRSLKGLLLLFVEPYTAGTRDSEKYINPSLKKVVVTVNGSTNKLFNNGLGITDTWAEVDRFFGKKAQKTKHMNPVKFFTEDRFGLLIDLRTSGDPTLHGSGTRLVNTTHGVQLEIERDLIGAGDVKCHIFAISDAQIDIKNQQLVSVLH